MYFNHASTLCCEIFLQSKHPLLYTHSNSPYQFRRVPHFHIFFLLINSRLIPHNFLISNCSNEMSQLDKIIIHFTCWQRLTSFPTTRNIKKTDEYGKILVLHTKCHSYTHIHTHHTHCEFLYLWMQYVYQAISQQYYIKIEITII